MAPALSPILGSTTTGRLQFVAYDGVYVLWMGVALLATFPTQPLMNVTAAPVVRAPSAPLPRVIILARRRRLLLQAAAEASGEPLLITGGSLPWSKFEAPPV
jgi:hypothetical protein